MFLSAVKFVASVFFSVYNNSIEYLIVTIRRRYVDLFVRGRHICF
jgi:hypothetical protein